MTRLVCITSLIAFSFLAAINDASAQLPKRPGQNRICGCWCDTGGFIAPQYYTFAYECLFLHGATCSAEDPQTHLIRTGKLKACEEKSQAPAYEPPVGTRPPGYRPPPDAPPIAEPPRRR
jgi:hypothetical protein